MKPNTEIGSDNRFLDIIDIDKRTFGVGPIKITPHAAIPQRNAITSNVSEKQDRNSKDGMRRSISADDMPKRRGKGGLQGRLDVLAQQLEQIEQSAYALQHDLAFSSKVAMLKVFY